MTGIMYKTEQEPDFDEMVETLKTMPEAEQEKLKQVFRGIMIGVELGKQKNEKEPVA